MLTVSTGFRGMRSPAIAIAVLVVGRSIRKLLLALTVEAEDYLAFYGLFSPILHMGILLSID